MNTGSKFTFQYGRVEARIKVPKGNGFWPAFWMMGADFLTGRPWPYNGEIDIMEVLGANTSELLDAARAGVQRRGGYGFSTTPRGPVQRLPRLGRRVGQQRHPLLLDTPVLLRQQGDGRGDPRAVVYDHPFYIILNLAVGGDFPGPVDATTPFPSQMVRRLRPRLQLSATPSTIRNTAGAARPAAPAFRPSKSPRSRLDVPYRLPGYYRADGRAAPGRVSPVGRLRIRS
jgi:hypothetical protein